MWNFLFPRYCILCCERLTPFEEHVCANCLSSLPYINISDTTNNPIEQIYRGLVPIHGATAFFLYTTAETRHIIHTAKYHNHPLVARYITSVLVTTRVPSNFFEGIDAIIPVPITPYHFKRRKYNQSIYIARGISDVYHLPIVCNAVCRRDSHDTQTRKSLIGRRAMDKSEFIVTDVSAVAGRHLLVVDDVITSGATTRALCEALVDAGVARVSVLAMAYAFEFANVNSVSRTTNTATLTSTLLP